MGWISDRHMRQGGSIGGNPKKCRETCRFPLRKIVQVTRPQQTIFEPNAVEFDCGHAGHAYGALRGRCKQCPPRRDSAVAPRSQRDPPPTSPPGPGLPPRREPTSEARRVFWRAWASRAQRDLGALLADIADHAPAEDDTIFACVNQLIDVEQQLSAVVDDDRG